MIDVHKAGIDAAEDGQVVRRAYELLVQVDVLHAPADDGRVEAADRSQVAVVDGHEAEAELTPVALVGAKRGLLLLLLLLLLFLTWPDDSTRIAPRGSRFVEHVEQVVRLAVLAEHDRIVDLPVADGVEARAQQEGGVERHVHVHEHEQIVRREESGARLAADGAREARVVDSHDRERPVVAARHRRVLVIVGAHAILVRQVGERELDVLLPAALPLLLLLEEHDGEAHTPPLARIAQHDALVVGHEAAEYVRSALERQHNAHDLVGHVASHLQRFDFVDLKVHFFLMFVVVVVVGAELERGERVTHVGVAPHRHGHLAALVLAVDELRVEYVVDAEQRLVAHVAVEQLLEVDEAAALQRVRVHALHELAQGVDEGASPVALEAALGRHVRGREQTAREEVEVVTLVASSSSLLLLVASRRLHRAGHRRWHLEPIAQQILFVFGGGVACDSSLLSLTLFEQLVLQLKDVASEQEPLVSELDDASHGEERVYAIEVRVALDRMQRDGAQRLA